MPPWSLVRRRFAEALVLAFLALFGAMSAAPQSRGPAITEGSIAAESSEENAAEEAIPAAAIGVARKAAERAHPAPPPARAARVRRARLDVEAARHHARIASYEPPLRRPPFRLLN